MPYAPERAEIIHPAGENHWRHALTNTGQPMLITQHLGNIWVGIEWAAETLNLPTFTKLKRQIYGEEIDPTPAPFTHEATEIGLKQVNADLCHPIKVITGYLFQALAEFEQLQETNGQNYYPVFLGHESGGQCRERCYYKLLEMYLQELSLDHFGQCNFDMYSVRESKQGMVEMIQYLTILSGQPSINLPRIGTVPVHLRSTVSLINEAIARINLAEQLETHTRKMQSHLSKSGRFETDNWLKDAKQELASTHYSLEEVHLLVETEQDRMKDLCQEERDQGIADPHLGEMAVVGEIFQAAGWSNPETLFLGRELARYGFSFEVLTGVEHYTHRFEISLKAFLKYYLSRMFGLPTERDRMKQLAARGGLTHDIGGHGLETIAAIVDINDRRLQGLPTYDGVIIIQPSNCLPQITADNIIRGENSPLRGGVPILSLIISDQTAEAGLMTRLEAFCDLVAREKTKKI